MQTIIKSPKTEHLLEKKLTQITLSTAEAVLITTSCLGLMPSPHIHHFLMSRLSTLWFLPALPRVTSCLRLLHSTVTTCPLRLADNFAPRRLRHVRLARKRPRAQKSHAPFSKSRPTFGLSPSVHLPRGREQAHVRLHVGHSVAPNPAGLLQVGLTLLLHQRSQRRRVR